MTFNENQMKIFVLLAIIYSSFVDLRKFQKDLQVSRRLAGGGWRKRKKDHRWASERRPSPSYINWFRTGYLDI